MSSRSGKNSARKSSPDSPRSPNRRIARALFRGGVVDPVQLTGLRARTHIRPGAATPRRDLMVSVGVDVSKAALMIAVHPTSERWTSETTPAAIEAVVLRLQTLAPAIIVVEATGGYERAFV